MKVNGAEFLSLSQEILNRGALLCFRAQGESMRPFINHGDVLIVEPVNGKPLRPGDVILSRHRNKTVLAHRIVRIEDLGKGMSYITKGDSLDYFDPPVGTDKIMGKVVTVERDGKSIRLDRSFFRLTGRLWAAVSPMSRHLRPFLRILWRIYKAFRSGAFIKKPIGYLMGLVQGIPLYRRLAGRLQTGVNIVEAGETEKPAVADSPGSAIGEPKPDVTCFLAKRRGGTIGSVFLVRYPEEYRPYHGYWITDLMVKTGHRGAGTGEALSRRCIERCLEEGADTVNLFVDEDNRRAINLYRKLGFIIRHDSAFKKQLRDIRRKFGLRRQVMSLILTAEEERVEI